MEYVIAKLQGKQYILKPGDTVVLNGTIAKPEAEIQMGEVLLVKNGEAKIGQPTLDEKLTFKVIEQGKSDKVRVATYRAKSRYRRTKGHRQEQTTLEFVGIGKTAKKAAKKSTSAKTPKKTTKKSK